MTASPSSLTALEGWVRCSCDGSCGVEIPVTLQWDRTTDTPVITHYPSQCPDSKAHLHQPPYATREDLFRAWYDAVNERVSDDVVADVMDCFPFDARD